MSPASERPASGSAPAGLGPRDDAGKTGMWVFLAADCMGFAGLLAAHGALRARAAVGADPGEHLAPALALGLTLLLVASSATMSAAVAAVARERHREGRLWLLATLALGMAFVAGQTFEFRALLGVPAHGLSIREPAAGLFFILTGYHGLHVLVGLVVLARLALHAAPSAAANRTAETLATASLYWQFVDVVWLVLFAALYLLPGVLRA